MNNQEKKLAIAEATFDAYNQADTLEKLIADFIESYIELEESQERLKWEAQHRPNRLAAKLYTILNIAHEVTKELEKLAE